MIEVSQERGNTARDVPNGKEKRRKKHGQWTSEGEECKK